MKLMLVALGLALVAALAFTSFQLAPRSLPPPYPAPADGTGSTFPAPGGEQSVLTLEAATDISFMRPFIVGFQKAHPRVTVRYVDYLSSELLARATLACQRAGATPDLYVTVSTDHLVQLANDGCGAAVPKVVADPVPGWAKWRRNVIAFAVEPAVLVYDARLLKRAEVPTTHLALIDALRANSEAWRGRVGTYDIERSGSGYNYATFDARQSATYGRLIESFGRIQARTYCCSNVMVDAVQRGEILLAYNVQMSYATAAQTAGAPIGVILPTDYQAIQTRSVMMSRDARNHDDAVAFIQYLVSPRGQAVARAQITPPRDATTIGVVSETERLGQVSVDPSLLALRDRSRRERFIREWSQAVRPALDAR